MTLNREGGSGNYSLEAGALVLADQGEIISSISPSLDCSLCIDCTVTHTVCLGCCCIDEFDKMGSQHQALLEAMVSRVFPKPPYNVLNELVAFHLFNS